MGIINRDTRFNNLIKVIKSSEKISVNSKNALIEYISDIKKGNCNNDFYDDEFLERVVIELINYKGYNRIGQSPKEFLEALISRVKFIFPYGTKTDNYELLRDLFINSICNDTTIFNDKLFSLFDNKRDYVDIINIISRDDILQDYYEEICEYGISVAPFCQNQDILKREIISFANNIINCDDVDDLTKESLVEAKKRVGIYPVDEKTLSLIVSEAERAQGLIQKLEDLQTRVNNYHDDVDTIIKNGKKELMEERKKSIDNLQKFIDETKDAIIKRIDEYLVTIEENLKLESDKVFKQVLLDASNKINEIKILASGLTSRTTDELMRIKQTSDESVSMLKDYVENEPKLKSLLSDVKDKHELKELLSTLQLNRDAIVSPVVVSSSSASPKEVPATNAENVVAAPILIPGNDRVVVPMNSRVELPRNIDYTILRAFDEKIPFDTRIKEILARKKQLEGKGEFFHEMTDEVLRCIIEGDWVYLWGPSGCGKSYVIKQVAKLLGIDLVDNGKITDKYSIMAYNDPHGRFRATQAFVALVYGKLLSLDEFDNGNTDTQVVLNPLYSGLLDVLENPKEKRFITFAEDMSVAIHPNFRMISAGNTSGEGENNLFSSRGKIDESVLQRITPKKFYYDNAVEKIIFGSFKDWYDLFVKFREVCDLYAKKTGMDYSQGIVTTRDAAAIAKYINHNSKTLNQVLREKFIQVKDDNYLKFIMENISKMYSVDASSDIKERPLDKYSAKDLGRKLVYSCNQAIKTGRR